MNLPVFQEKSVINLILVSFMCLAILKGIQLPELFVYVLMFQLGMHSSNKAVNDQNTQIKALQDNNAKLTEQNTYLTTQAMRSGLAIPSEENKKP